MRYTFVRAAIPMMVCALILAVAHSEPPSSSKDSEELQIYSPDNLKWQDGPPSLPKGAMVAVLEGDPTKEGSFVMRAKMPDGYRVPPHTHGKTERVTVMSGTFYIGMGEKFDEKAGKEMKPGSFGYWPAGMKHFAWVKGE